jgi:hypothetical protein
MATLQVKVLLPAGCRGRRSALALLSRIRRHCTMVTRDAGACAANTAFVREAALGNKPTETPDSCCKSCCTWRSCLPASAASSSAKHSCCCTCVT